MMIDDLRAVLRSFCQAVLQFWDVFLTRHCDGFCFIVRDSLKFVEREADLAHSIYMDT